jgi:hypothetical protein
LPSYNDLSTGRGIERKVERGKVGIGGRKLKREVQHNGIEWRGKE